MDTPVEAAVKQPITEKDLDPVDMRFAKLWVQSRKAALAESEEQQSKPENRAKDDLRVRGPTRASDSGLLTRPYEDLEQPGWSAGHAPKLPLLIARRRLMQPFVPVQRRCTRQS